MRKSGEHSQARIHELVMLLTEPAAFLIPDGTIGFCNDSFAQTTALDASGAQRSSFSALLDPDDQRVLNYFLTASHVSRKDRNSLLTNIQPPNAASRSAQIVRIEDEAGTLGYLCQILPGQAVQDPLLRYVMEHLDMGVWDYDTRTGMFTVSNGWCKIRGLPPRTQTADMGGEWLKDVHPEDRKNLKNVFQGQIEGRSKRIVIQYRFRHTSGHWVWVLCRASVMEVDSQGLPIKIVGTDTDISQVKEGEDELFKLTSKFQLAIEASGMGIWEFDSNTSLVHWDDRMLEIYGITDQNYVRSENLWETYIHPDDLADTVAYAEECQEANADFVRDYRIVRPDGKIRHIRSLARSVETSDEKSKLIGVNIDVTDDYMRAEELELARSRLEHEARHDGLTGLGNRRKLDELTVAFFNAIPQENAYAAMHIDLDHFKQVNDTLGHSAGDYVLSIVARRLNRIIGDAGLVFRVGGDEFTVFFETAPSNRTLRTLCQNLITELSAPTLFQGEDCTIGASIGYAFGKGPPGNPSEVFVNADTALYSAKHAGRSCFRSYSRSLETQVSQVSNARQSILDAIENNEITCHFQPQFDAKTLEIVGAEALVRWQCPSRGLLTPDKFLPQAIGAGLLPKIDECVFKFVIDQQTQWAKDGIWFPNVSVNISRARLDADNLISQTKALIAPHHIISFELLETAFLDKIDTLLAFKLDTLRELGISIELDDFGSGHSSIAALQAIGPDRVKIDRSLVSPLSTKPSQLLTLRSLAKIARLEAADIVVEGLETGIELAAIRDLDCDVLQGYALQRPMPVIEWTALLQRAPAAAHQR